MILRHTSTRRGQADRNLEAPGHVTGQSLYVDDYPEVAGTLYALAVPSPVAHGHITALEVRDAAQVDGVVRVFTAEDIPGQNQIGGIVADEPLLATGEVHYRGQPVALIIAVSPEQAHAARTSVQLRIDEKEVITDPREAFARGMLLHRSRRFQMGDVKTAFASCAVVVEGQVEIAGQEHVYIEPQGAYAIPTESGGLRIYSSTQGPTHGQRTIARVLGIPMHQIEIDVGRIGGGFGGKEDQATMWAAMVALAAHHLQRPVKYILDRSDDMIMTGKRHPYSCDYKMGLDQNGKVLAYQATFFQNGGAAADLSPAVLERTLFHATNSYFIPNVEVTAHCCKTHVPPNTAFRGFGGPQGMFVIEAAMHHAARSLSCHPSDLQRKNLLRQGDVFPYGQKIIDDLAIRCWDDAVSRYQLETHQEEIAVFNAAHELTKKGLAVMPVCFGISFTNTQMNQARALVHVYSDGSVGVSTGAVEMGQGVNTKMIQVAAQAFGISTDLVRLETTNTTRVANTSPSAASSTADLNGKALQEACGQITERLNKLRAELEEPLTWHELISLAIARRVNLSAKGHYATPVIHFDKEKEKGHPFAYHVNGTAILVARIDCVRGTYDFERVQIVHDSGSSMNRAVDLGQIEGGLVQGMGWTTLEELRYGEDGRLLSSTLATYKIPGIYSIPEHIDVHFLESDGAEHAILRSKAVGEPPLMYGIGAYFALYNAILAFNPQARVPYSSPMTPEKVLMALYQGR
ncbi:MAG: molybdopterin cofactor-binding domain-containing protein [Saprospiraceae bacterium]|nr:molybdopterin cofactor-binding domain-containing protein [Saprospiraceae bacterium]